ncbi:glycoside hydrolase family 65 protein [Nocardioides salsibiostraticola]
MDRGRFPADPWRLVETSHSPEDLGVTETLFSVANGYLGMRGNPEEGRDAFAHGTFLNGFHETWPIRHAEAAFGFAQTGQTIVNVPDAKVLKIYVDDEPLTLGTADLEYYERTLDFRDGILRRSLIWRTPSGKRVQIDSTRMVSMTQRHLAIITLEVTMLSGNAPIVISSQIINRQDGRDEYTSSTSAMGLGADPRKAAEFEDRVLLPRVSSNDDDRMILGYRCANSEMTIAIAADHRIQCEDPYEVVNRHEDDLAKRVFRIDAREGRPVRIEKAVAYHSSRGVAVRELADRCDRTLDRVARQGLEHHLVEQREWYDEFWASSDVQIDLPATTTDGEPTPNPEALQQAIRYNLFSLAQASARADQQGVPAKGVTGSGYEGHYFWDTEVYVTPFLTYTSPAIARNTLQFRRRMLPAAQTRAGEMAQRGALFPWRTINGEEASAYYAAGTAQVHIDADIAYALMKYVHASGDTAFLVRDGIDILVETSRMWADLGFWRHNSHPSFHIHGVTGPDEYTTVVNNNLFTNVMARANLEAAVEAIEEIRCDHPAEYFAIVHRLGLTDAEIGEWRACAEGMAIPFDTGLGIHPQDDFFLDREAWDLSRTPSHLRPLLLHYHPLVIYRFQVLKQADVVLALFLQGDRFTTEEKKADFEYYDPITTGDSTLSAVVQSIVASEVGYHEIALSYFHQALYVDLMNLHGNTVDGLHIASAGGVWGSLVNGFGGMRDHRGRLSFDPRLPEEWEALRFPLTWHGVRVAFELTATELTAEVVAVSTDAAHSGADEVTFDVRGVEFVVREGAPVRIPLDGQGPRLAGQATDKPQLGGSRADGTMITAGVPQPVSYADAHVTGEVPADSESARQHEGRSHF